MSAVDRALLSLDGPSLALVRPALAGLRSTGSGPGTPGAAPGETPVPDVRRLQRFLWHELPEPAAGRGLELHEVAWALGELFEHAGLAEQAALCRASTTHEVLAVWRWTGSFPDVPAEFWRPALGGLGDRPGPPPRARLSLAAAKALLEAVGEGLRLGAAGGLPRATVVALDDRFRWTDEFPWMRPPGEVDIPPLGFLHQHLESQRLLVRDGGMLRVTPEGWAALASTARLWSAVVEPAPRWQQEFEQDALGVMAAVLLRTGAFTSGRITEEIVRVLAAKWRPAAQGSVFDGASVVVQEWYQLGVPLGWWDTGRGPADRHPNVLGRAAVEAVFRSAKGRAAERPA